MVFCGSGTGNGLNRFDGISFKIFRNDPNNEQSIPGNYIAGTTLDKKGYLWIATNYGLCRLNTRTLKIDRVDLKDSSDNYPRYDVMYW
jgi:ligand-binding sensor domain-containing protein